MLVVIQFLAPTPTVGDFTCMDLKQKWFFFLNQLKIAVSPKMGDFAGVIDPKPL